MSGKRLASGFYLDVQSIILRPNMAASHKDAITAVKFVHMRKSIMYMVEKGGLMYFGVSERSMHMRFSERFRELSALRGQSCPKYRRMWRYRLFLQSDRGQSLGVRALHGQCNDISWDKAWHPLQILGMLRNASDL